MKLITRDTDYALRALCFVAKSKDRVVSVSQLVDSLKIPRPFLRKNLQLLNKRGVLKSYKGLGGGFKLARKPRQLFISELIRIFQGPFQLNECFLKKRPCPHKKECVLKKKIDNIERYVIGQLDSITLADLL
ncbi:MAG: Rrf2 family transcriptional regulator [bacterium]